MIDPRYPPQPHRTLASLYPLQREVNICLAFSSRIKSSATELADRIVKKLNANLGACFLGTSARHVLGHFLKWLHQEKQRRIVVAVPDFYCPHTLKEIIGSGANVVLIDINEHFTISSMTVDSLTRVGCDVLIWPDLFAIQPLNLDFFNDVASRGIIIIRDLAHTFPLIGSNQTEGVPAATLVSFGHTKPLAGIGGGGIVLHDFILCQNFSEYLHSLASSRPTSAGSELAKQATSAWYKLLRLHVPHLSTALGFLSPLATRQNDLLESLLGEIANAEDPQAWLPISPFEAAIALDRWDRMISIWDCHKDWQLTLIDSVQSAIGPASVTHLKYTDSVSIVAVRVPSHLRYSTSCRLAEQGFQTTWYYYPLGLLSGFARYQSRQMPVSEQLAGQILILPCHWGHTENNTQYDVNAIQDTLRCALNS